MVFIGWLVVLIIAVGMSFISMVTLLFGNYTGKSDGESIIILALTAVAWYFVISLAPFSYTG